MKPRHGPISRKARHIKSFIAMDMLEAAQGLERLGHDIIPFSLGEPDFEAPRVVKDACIRAIRENLTKYTHSQGLLKLRVAVAAHYRSKYGVHVDPECVIVTPGTSPAFFLIFSTLLEKGDEVILSDPHYPCDKNFVEFFDGRVRTVRLSEADSFHWDMKAVRGVINRRTRAIFATSPANPTGAVMSAAEIRALVAMGKTLVSDEIYHGLSYGPREHTALEFTKDCFVVNGFSKAYAMTGFRLGYVIAPPKYVAAMRRIQQNFTISTTSFVQMAGIAALTSAQQDVTRMRDEFRVRRDLMLAGLKRIGFPIRYVPEGAFYIMANSRHLGGDSYHLAFDILKKAHVAVTPGIDFGRGGEGYLRFSYAVKPRLIRAGLCRLESYLQRNKRHQKTLLMAKERIRNVS